MNTQQKTSKLSLAGLFLPFSLFFGFVFWRLRRRSATLLSTAMLLLLSAAAFMVTGCNSFSVNTAAPGNYVIQVTGTGANSSAEQFQNVSLTITK